MRHLLLLSFALVLPAARARADAEGPPGFYLSAVQQPLPGQDAQVQVRSRGEEAGPADAVVYRIGDPAALLAAQPDWRRMLVAPGSLLAQEIAAAKEGKRGALGLSLVHQQSLEVDADYAKPAAVRFTAARPGLYLVAVELNLSVAYALVNCSSLALVWKRSPSDAVAFAADRVSGAPRPGVRVRALIGETELARADTAADGLARLELPYRPKLRVLAQQGDELALLEHELYPAAPPALKGYLFSERPVYRPGETVYLKGILRELHDEAPLPPPEGTEVLLEVVDARGGSLLKAKRLALSADGSFTADLALPKDAALGRWSIRASAGGARFAGEFEVQEFQKPQFVVEVRADKPQAISGEPAVVDVSASYYGGGPVSGGDVRFKITRARFDRPLWRRARPSWYQGEAELRAGEDELVEEGRGALDAKGTLHLRFDTKAGDEDFTYRAVVTVFDAARAAATGSASVLATKGEFQIAARASRAVVPLGDEVEIQLAARSYAGAPVQTGVDVVLLDLDTSAAGAGLAGGVRRSLGERRLQTGADGTASFRFRPEHAGHLRVAARAKDSRGRELIAATYFWAAGNEPVALRAEGLQLVADKDTYTPGETAQLLVVAPRADAHVFLAVEGRRVAHAEVRRALGNALLIPLRIDAQLATLAPNLHLSVTVVGDEKILHAPLQLAVAPVARLVNVSVETDRPRYGPREQGRVRVRTTDAQGRPVSAEVSLAAVDEAVYAVTPELAPPIAQFFVPRRRNAVGSADSSATASYGYAVGLPGRAERVAELRRQYESAMAQQEQQRSRREEARASSSSRQRSYAMAASEGVSELLARPPPAPSGIARAAEPGRGGSGLGVMGVRGMGRAGQGHAKADVELPTSRPKVEERKEFATTILWRPSIRTNAGGLGEVDLGFPDDLTAWRFTARATTTDGRFGDATAQAITAQALQARLSVPQSLTERDQVALGATVQNNTHRALTVQLSLQAQGLRVGEPSRTLEVPAGESAGLTFLAEVLDATTASLKLTATSGQVADALSLSLPVQPHGAPRFSHASGLLGQGDGRATLVLAPGTRPGTARLLIRALSGPQAAIDGALPSLIGYPYGCVEQTLSKFVPDLVALRVLQRSGRGEGQARLQARLDELPAMVAAGVARLQQLQNPDGTFGWFEDQGFDPLMTAHAVAALGRARDAGADLPEELVEKTTQAGLRIAASDAPLEVRAEAVYGLAFLAPGDAVTIAKELLPAARSGSPFSQALLSLAFATQTHREEARELAQLLARSIKPGAADNAGARPLHGEVEVAAWALSALAGAAVAPEVAEALARSLYEARHGGAWASTRDSSAAVMAFADYLFAQRGSARGQGTLVVRLNGRPAGRVALQDGEASLELHEGLVPGDNQLVLRHQGAGFAAFDAQLSSLSGAELTEPTDSGLRVSRRVSLLVADGARYREEPLVGSQPLRAGDVVLVRVAVHTAEPRAYVIVEAPRPSGFSVVTDQAQYPLQAAAPTLAREVHREDRAGFTAFFLRELPRGATEFTVLLRAEQAGRKHVLPVVAQAMYTPEIAGASGELEVTVQ